jgi:hypothetical protein
LRLSDVFRPKIIDIYSNILKQFGVIVLIQPKWGGSQPLANLLLLRTLSIQREDNITDTFFQFLPAVIISLHKKS